MLENCKACENGTLTIEYQRELVVGHCPFCKGTGQRDYEAERKADAEFTAQLNSALAVMEAVMERGGFK